MIAHNHHIGKHGQKKRQKTVAESAGAQPRRQFLPRGKTQTAAEQLKELPAITVVIAVSLVPRQQGKAERRKKTDHAEPCKQNIDKAQREIHDGEDPKVLIPSRPPLPHVCTSIRMTSAGHSRLHIPQPTQCAGSTVA